MMLLRWQRISWMRLLRPILLLLQEAVKSVSCVCPTDVIQVGRPCHTYSDTPYDTLSPTSSDTLLTHPLPLLLPSSDTQITSHLTIYLFSGSETYDMAGITELLRKGGITMDSVTLGQDHHNVILQHISLATKGYCFNPDSLKQALAIFELETVLSMAIRAPQTILPSRYTHINMLILYPY